MKKPPHGRLIEGNDQTPPQQSAVVYQTLDVTVRVMRLTCPDVRSKVKDSAALVAKHAA